MSLQLNLEKSQAALQLCLAKAGILTPPTVDLAFVLDVSGSFEDEHRAGITGQLLTRLVPWGLTFDPDRQLEVFTFSSGPGSAHAVGAVHAGNYGGYVEKHIVARVPGWGAGTDYSYVIDSVLRRFGWQQEAAQPGLLTRFWGQFCGQPQKSPENAPGRPTLVIFVTDGENSDHARTLDVLRASQQRGDGVYFLFLGISNQGSRFPFLEKIGGLFANTGFVAIKDLKDFVTRDDAAVNQALLGEELLAWLRLNTD